MDQNTMYFNIDIEYKNIYNDDIKNKLAEINQLMFDETKKFNKVVYYYENIGTKDVFSYNKNICFYAASTTKILVCFILFEMASLGEIDLSKEILIKMEDLRSGTGVLKNQKEDSFYSILKLIELSITESDNTAYVALMNLISKDYVKNYFKKLGANHTMEGKETDYFGIINCADFIIYLKKIKEFIDENKEYGNLFKKYLLNLR